MLVTKVQAKNLISSRYSLLHPLAGSNCPMPRLFPASPSCMHLQGQPPMLFSPYTPCSSEICSLPEQPELPASAKDLTASEGLSLFILITYSRLFPPCQFVCLNKKRQVWLRATSVPRLGKPSAKLSDSGPHPALPVGTLCSSSSLLVLSI